MNLEKWMNWLSDIQKKMPFDTLRAALIVGTYILGEIGFFPFGSTFRLGLGSVFYVLCLYTFPRLATLVNGCLTGAVVVFIRVIADRFIYVRPLSWHNLILENAPALIYYLALTGGILVSKVRYWKTNTIKTSLYFMVFDLIANLLEFAFTANVHTTWHSIYVLVLGAGVKGLFFLAFIATTELFRQRILQEKEREKFQGQLLMGATLYAEGFFLKKIMKEIEEATEKSFQLYQEYLPESASLSQQNELLKLAEKIHEIKKDTQRVFSSLESLIEPNDYTRIDLGEALDLVVESQQRYAFAHHKEVQWLRSSGSNHYFVENFFPILVVVNNILANGIDAIARSGEIAVVWHVREETLYLHLGNTGKPISPDDRELIFLPGFTTKYSDSGTASTGIGLTHVLHVLAEVKGTVSISQTEGRQIWTWFHVQLPIV
ncbi:sensor histidine kinase GlnK [Desulfosporosinus acididurans]|uniref:Sensor histidine kinase GlnK n=1 Tax=Desulfosporosinus acididurans TaxID=476652 RepID=A0A0J1IKC0_9FIRM|nr:sensor histidine kinase [Desulfosporosinus acididurans]KLU65171.1 sensor histidine kinase GlnK [Desulfosporosinus acididurans]